MEIDKAKLEIKRPNGQVEVVDYDGRNGRITPALLERMRVATRNAGRGEIIKATMTLPRSNMRELVKNYRNHFNEGKEGYMPVDKYFTALPEYKEWEETIEVK